MNLGEDRVKESASILAKEYVDNLADSLYSSDEYINHLLE